VQQHVRRRKVTQEVVAKEEAMARYSRGAGKTVKSAMRRRKRGTLKSGRSGKKVTSRKQAIAIGLSEARKKGARVPRKRSSRSRSRTSHRKAA
jgi:Family of unknown function (DUF6496)